MVTLIFTRKHTSEELGALNSHADFVSELDQADWTFNTTRNLRGVEVSTITITRAGTDGFDSTRLALTRLAATLGLHVTLA
ncbi:hypothetical protein [Deinococcus yavapaiensis]|uniref:Uncharacterized protein n=1 Tax=Deinococcus yavapaiensis KR-236 TaxID=694435 RepID=A0A318SEQ9_9DEIO|nr:hypothetical protein [Deinococcus yavapaiensis]PYE51819.1 hypothetical protein DES52_11419 [Deinococcus yavapaiensis KR-236]